MAGNARLSRRLGKTTRFGTTKWLQMQRTAGFVTTGSLRAIAISNVRSNYHIFPVNNFNDPMGTAGTGMTVRSTNDDDRHPLYHDLVLADGYDSAEVLAYTLLIDFRAGVFSTSSNDCVVCWRF